MNRCFIQQHFREEHCEALLERKKALVFLAHSVLARVDFARFAMALFVDLQVVVSADRQEDVLANCTSGGESNRLIFLFARYILAHTLVARSYVKKSAFHSMKANP